MKLLSFVLFFISTVSLALPLEDDNELLLDQPSSVLSNATNELLEDASELPESELPADEAKAEVFEDTSLEFLDEQTGDPLPEDEAFIIGEHVISKRSTEVARSIWDSIVEFIKLSLQSIWLIANKVVLEPWFGINSLLSRIFRTLNANMQIGVGKPGEPMVRYNLNGDFNVTSLLNWDYWTTHVVKMLTEQ